MLPAEETPLGTGVHTLYWNNGNLRSSFEYDLHIETMTIRYKDGTYKTYYENGIIQTQMTYKNNTLHGKYVYYDKNGIPKELLLFENGEIIETYRRSPNNPPKLQRVSMTN